MSIFLFCFIQFNPLIKSTMQQIGKPLVPSSGRSRKDPVETSALTRDNNRYHIQHTAPL